MTRTGLGLSPNHKQAFVVNMVKIAREQLQTKRSNLFIMAAAGAFCLWKTVQFTASKFNADER
jgi:hypothetical protein